MSNTYATGKQRPIYGKCSVFGCDYEGRVYAGMCSRHMSRQRRHGSPYAEGGGAKRIPPLDRFWRQVRFAVGGCMEWTGVLDIGGYGHFRMRVADKSKKLAHRASWELHVGPITDGLLVLHRCDNPACVNPDHLFLGTQKDNVDDMVAKGRHGLTGAKGVRNAQSKLTDGAVRLIRDSGDADAKLAEQFGVHSETIRRVRRRQIWGHVI